MCPTQHFLVASSLSDQRIKLLRFAIFCIHWHNLNPRNCFNISPISITRKDQTFTRNPKQQISSSTPQHLSGIAPLTHRHKSILPASHRPPQTPYTPKNTICTEVSSSPRPHASPTKAQQLHSSHA